MDCAIGILAIHINLQCYLRGWGVGNFHIARTFKGYLMARWLRRPPCRCWVAARSPQKL